MGFNLGFKGLMLLSCGQKLKSWGPSVGYQRNINPYPANVENMVSYQ